MDSTQCPVCSKPIEAGNPVCTHCGTNWTRRNLLDRIVKEIIHYFTHLGPQYWHTVYEWVNNPGAALKELTTKGYDRFHKPVSFLLISVVFFQLFGQYILIPQDWDIGVAYKVSKSILLLSLVALTLICWFVLFNPQLDYLLAFIACCYIFGSVLTLVPFLSIIPITFYSYLSPLPRHCRYVCADLLTLILTVSMLLKMANSLQFSRTRKAICAVTFSLLYTLLIIEGVKLNRNDTNDASSKMAGPKKEINTNPLSTPAINVRTSGYTGGSQ
ncbi:MAG: hypothetical protein KA821_06670 [Chitinophagaceae bacterium]|nr:hypothetical protein [Chitinophagaceae bacterium]